MILELFLMYIYWMNPVWLFTSFLAMSLDNCSQSPEAKK